jgi:tRNA threonylcarbamoyladenosine biosynthesis protein TsaB
VTAPTEARLLLALDTSTSLIGLALYDGQLLAEQSWPAGRHGSQTLLGEIDHLLRLLGRPIGAVTAVAVAVGPGSFSALRVGLSVAKGLVFALPASLLGIPTLDIVAYPHRRTDYTVWATIDAGRSRVFAAPYADQSDHWQAITPAVHGPAAGLLECVVGPAVVVGDIPPAVARALAQRPGVSLPPPALRQRRAGVLAELAWQRYQAGQSDDPVSLAPIYRAGGSSAAGA